MLEGDLAELIDRRWESRLLEKNGDVRVAVLVFHRDGKPVGDFKRPGLPPVRLQAFPTSCSTTCGALPPGTWSARVFPSASRWR
jgi:hypothetical protein